MFGTEKNPKGPSFKNLLTHEKNLSGAILTFKTPAPSGEANKWFTATPSVLDIYKSENYKLEDSKNDSRRLDVYSGAWQFTGIPIWNPEMGDVRLGVDIVEIDLLPENESLFNHSVLAREIKRNIEHDHISETHQKHGDGPYDLTVYEWPNYLEPLNWQWVKKSDKEWIYYEIQSLWHTSDFFAWITPITNTHYLRFYFNVTRLASNAGNPFRLAKRVPLKPYTDLMHHIMDTVNLSLSPEFATESQTFEKINASHLLPYVAPTEEQINQAKYILYMWSGKGYTEKNKKSCRANQADVSAFLDKRLVPHPIPGALTQTKKISAG